MDPRISFSNDFADMQQAIKYDGIYREAPVSSDFEFYVENYTMIPADEIFLKGMVLPLKDNCTNHLRKKTIRDELLANDDDDEELPAVPKSSGWWKERLNLKKSNAPKNSDFRNVVLEKVAEEKKTLFALQERFANNVTQKAGLLGGEI